jgi:Family of unknown function (DUF6289)
MIRRLVIAALIGTAVVAIPAVPAQANNGCVRNVECTTTFYSSAAHTTVVGQAVITCNGELAEWGTTSIYSVETYSTCD